MLSLNPGPWGCQTSITLTELCPRPSCHIFYTCMSSHVLASSLHFGIFFIQPEIFFTCPQHFMFAFVMKVMCLVLFLEHPVLCTALLAVRAFQFVVCPQLLCTGLQALWLRTEGATYKADSLLRGLRGQWRVWHSGDGTQRHIKQCIHVYTHSKPKCWGPALICFSHSSQNHHMESARLFLQEWLLMFASNFTTKALNNDLDISLLLQPGYSCLSPLSHLYHAWVLALTHLSAH